MRIPKGRNILEYLREQDQRIPAPCNGKGTCGKCKVLIKDSTVLPLEEQLLSKKEVQDFVRLACLRRVKEDTEIELLLQEDHASKDAFYKKPNIHQPYLRLKKENDHYDIFRNKVKIKESKHKEAYGLAIDIGTTTIAFALEDLTNGEILDYTSFSNPQTAYGSDVISRIDYAKSKEHLHKLSNLIRTKVDEQVKSFLQKNSIKDSTLYEVVIAANTTMVYLLLEKDPSPLAKAPYKADLLDRIETDYPTLFSNHYQATVTIYEGLDAYIGGDIVSGIVSEQLERKKDYHMLIDLGTNGEIVLINENHLYASATALGPAFEGVNITCGLGAVKGAIDHFRYPDQCYTIEDKEPIGLCGSGLIDLVHELVKNQFIDQTGRLKETFYLTDEVFLNQKDVRQIQLAKAALKAGIEHLALDADVSLKDIKTLYIAGGFGQYTNPDHLIAIGMIPSAFKGKIEILGNASLNGALHYLSSPIRTSFFTKHKIHIRTLTTPLFQELFVKNMHFPTKKQAN